MLASLDVAVGLGEDTLLWPGECPQQQGTVAGVPLVPTAERELGGGDAECCIWGSTGHEYALECLTFASLLELDNSALEQKLQWAVQQRQEKRSTVRHGGPLAAAPTTPTPHGVPLAGMLHPNTLLHGGCHSGRG